MPSLEAILVEEHDSHVSVGEIGITAKAGAVANAIWHATGFACAKFPITLDRLI